MGIAFTDNGTLIDDRLGSLVLVPTEDGGQIATYIDDQKRIVTRRFDPNGIEIGDEIVVVKHVNPAQVEGMQLFARTDGGWIQSYSIYNKETKFYVAQYDADGTLVSNTLQPPGTDEKIALLSNDGYLSLRYSDYEHYRYKLTVTVFDASGDKIGETVVGYADPREDMDMSLANGMWSVKTYDKKGHTSSLLLDAQGNLLNTVAFNKYETVVFDDTGGYTVTRKTVDNDVTTDDFVTYRKYDADNVLIDTVISAPYDPDFFYNREHVVHLNNGNQLVIWNASNIHRGVAALTRLLDAEGNLIRKDLLLGGTFDTPDAMGLPDGGFVVFWDGYQQVYNADGSKHGSRTVIIPEYGTILNVFATADGGWTVSYLAGSGGDEVRTRTFHANDINNAPLARSLTLGLLEDKSVKIGTMSLGYDFDGDAFGGIIIKALPTAGHLTLEGKDVAVGDAISALDLRKLTWTPPHDMFGKFASLKFQAVDEHGAVSENIGTLRFSVNNVNDAPSSADKVITIREDEKIALGPDFFPFVDIDGNHIQRVRLKTIDAAGHLAINGHDVIYARTANFSSIFSNSISYQSAQDEYGHHYATFGFRVSDSGGTYNHGRDTDTEWHTLTINVLPVNDAPLGHNISLTVSEGQEVDFIDNYFTIDDVENDKLQSIIIDELPADGTLRLDGHRVKAGDEIAIDDVHKLSFRAPAYPLPFGTATVKFSIQDDGGTKNGGIDIDTKSNSLTFNVGTDSTVLWGTEGNDVLTGTGKRDVIYGGLGDDRIVCSKGHDALYGGSGRDTFVFGTGVTKNRIMDFNIEEDRIDLSDTPIHSFASLLKHCRSYSDMVSISFSTGHGNQYEIDHLDLQHITKGDLTESNFIF